MFDWIREHQTLFYWLTGASVVLFVATLITVPLMLIRIPPDYFAHQAHRPRERKDRQPIARLGLRIGRNVLGVVLILAGIIMLALPGQGLLAILAGVMITEFPGKYRVARWIVSRRRVLGAINWLRKRAKREPLRVNTGADPPSRGGGAAARSARRAA